MHSPWTWFAQDKIDVTCPIGLLKIYFIFCVSCSASSIFEVKIYFIFYIKVLSSYVFQVKVYFISCVSYSFIHLLGQNILHLLRQNTPPRHHSRRSFARYLEVAASSRVP